jgi:DNA gyrase subunit A
MEVIDDDDLMLITNHAIILRIHIGNIRVTGRNTMGVRLMKLDSGDTISDIARVVKSEENVENGEFENNDG